MTEEKLLDDLITYEGDQVLYNATLGKRFANYLIDNVLLGFAMRYLPMYQIYSYTGSWGFSPYSSIGLSFIYYLLTELLLGQSLGKLLTNTIVVNSIGQRPNLGQVVIRTLVRMIPLFDALSFLFSSDKRGLHDKWSKTYVINKP